MSDKKHDRKKRVWQRLLVFVLCFCVWFTPYSDMSRWSFAFAQENEAAWCNAGEEELSYGSFEQALENVGNGGTVILRSDVCLTKSITVSKSITITSWSSDAPCTIKNAEQDSDNREEYGKIFTVSNCQLILQNIILDGGKDDGAYAYRPLICVKNGAAVRMLSGTVLQNAENRSESFCSGGVSIRSGVLYMYDGAVIKNCKARHGGGVEVNSESKPPNGAMFGMAGGSIENCTANCGGGVYVNIGQFQMLGGKITGNSATSGRYGEGGGGIYVASPYHKYVAAVRITGGEISNNTADSNGGGVLVNGSYAQFYLEGGTLKNNHASTGAGVNMILGTMRLYGGTITENTAELYGGGVLGSPNSRIYLQGAPQVFANTAKDKEDSFDNVYLDGNRESNPTSPIQITGPLGDGIRLGLTRWVRPDDTNYAAEDMIVSDGRYTITQNDLDKLSYNREQKTGLYADNMQDFGFIPLNGKIVMVLAVDVALDKETLSFDGTVDPSEKITATVTPANAPEKGVTWKSSNENVATVDENGNVSPKGGGKAIITATTKSPYNAEAQCTVTVGYKLSTETEHGTNTFTPVDSEGYFLSGENITLHTDADEGYQFHSLRAYRTDNETEAVNISGNTLTMPNCDVTVKAVFEPIAYTINYDLDGGEEKADKTNPVSYTIESNGITLNNPTKSGYTFVGWTGTGLAEPTLSVTIPSGSMGAREYKAHWEENVYRLTTKAEHGALTYTSDTAGEYFKKGDTLTLQTDADKGYQFHSLRAYRTDDETETVNISGNTIIMPDHDITVEAVFEPIAYTIDYDLDGGELKADEINPVSYTIESGEITLNNPTKSGHTFVGWTGTGLTEPTLSVTIPSGSMGAREYKAHWEENVYRLTTKAEHGTLINTSQQRSTEFFAENTVITLQPVADEGYQLYSLKAYRTDDKSTEVDINGNTLTMPNCDVTVKAVFEPIAYTINYDLDGGELKSNETNPVSYTIESDGITLNNPTKSGYTFAGWTGTGLAEPTLSVTIPSGSMGARGYAALWEDENSDESGGGNSSGDSDVGGSSHHHRYIYDKTIIKEPTCTENGEKTLSCSCGQTTTETVPALGHDYHSEITKPATETEDGVRTFTCTRCGDTYTEVIKKLGDESKPSDTSSSTPDDTSSNTSNDTSSGTSDDTSSSTSDDTSSSTSDDTSSSTSDDTSSSTSDDTSSSTSNDTSSGTSDDTSSSTSDNTSSETSTSGDATSSDSGDTSSDNSGSSSGDNGTSSSGSTGEDNPITGVAAAFPLMAVIAAAAVLAVTESRKRL